VEATAAPPVVVRDVFPARVVIGDRVLTSARAVITRDRLVVYIERGEPAVDEPYLPEVSTVPAYNASQREVAYVYLGEGRIAVVTRQRGCACSSTLRGWHPWAPWRVGS
jgi:hypothetical protein